MAERLCRLALMTAALVMAAGGVLAQESEDLAAAADAVLERMDQLEALAAIEESLAGVREEAAAAERQLRRATTDEDRLSAEEALADLARRAAGLEEDFRHVATGIDFTLFAQIEEEEFDWRDAVEEIFEPVALELRSAAAHPREVEELRAEVSLYERRLPEIEQALQRLAELGEEAAGTSIEARLAALAEHWSHQQAEQMTQLDAARLRLDEKLSERRSIGETLRDVIMIFFRRRGRNLMLAIASFLGIFLLLRWLQGYLHRATPDSRIAGSRFLARLVDVLYYLFTVVAAITALLAVLYMSGDWVLLGIAVLFLVGLAWALKNTLPAFLDQARLMLNLGPVREGERLVYLGVPWRVDSLNLYTDLENAELQGGRLRLPLKELASLRSRPFDEKQELWFPTRLDDWVVMADGFYGRIIRQTPEEVVIATGRGSEKAYRTTDFLAQRPKNLSIATFAVNQPLRLALSHRDEALREIPEKLKATVEEVVGRQPYADCLEQVITELKEIDESALNFNVIAKFSGGAASEYTEIGWLLSQAALEASNRHGWKIPYPQLTVHRPTEG